MIAAKPTPSCGCNTKQSERHPVDLESLDDLERPVFDILVPWFNKLNDGQEHYTPNKFVTIITPVIDNCIERDVERQLDEYWQQISKVGVPKDVYAQLLTETLKEVYKSYLPLLADEINKNKKPEQFNQNRAYAVATTEITALRALVMLVLMGTYNDLVETGLQKQSQGR